MTESEVERYFRAFDEDLMKHGLKDTTPEDLEKYAVALCRKPAQMDSKIPQMQMYLMTVQNLQMARLIASLEKKNETTQKWFMVLAVGGLVIAVIGIFAAAG